MTQDFRRYKRQLAIDGWGKETQERLSKAHVFIAGAGGLGCPVAMNLALAGAGHLTICDTDTVDITNLNRQFLHNEKSIGLEKTLSAQKTLEAINSEVSIKTAQCKITHENIESLLGNAQIIIDCLDNFEARYALNRAALKKNIPLVHGAVWGMEGRITVFHAPETPCLECMFPNAPSTGETPVMGGVTSAVGSMQAIEAIRFLAGQDMSLKGRMLIMDFAAMKFQELEIWPDPECPACSTSKR